jgi:hypothetical protein
VRPTAVLSGTAAAAARAESLQSSPLPSRYEIIFMQTVAFLPDNDASVDSVLLRCGSLLEEMDDVLLGFEPLSRGEGMHLPIRERLEPVVRFFGRGVRGRKARVRA